MSSGYDVIVVGAGPAGLSTAKTVSKRGLRCLVVERNKEIGFPVRTSGASWPQEMIEFGIPSNYLNLISKVSVVGPKEEATFDFGKPVACLLDVTEVYRFLASQARHCGADLKLQSHARNVIVRNGFVRGIELETEGGLERINCDVVVDASGVNAYMVRKLGLLERWARKGIGVQYDIESSSVDSEKAMLFLGEKVAPSGYGWFFPWKKDRARVGVGIIRPDSNLNPDSFAKALLKSNRIPELKNDYRIIRKEIGIFPCSGPIKTTIANGFVAVGDAAGLGSPLHGEGIRYAIKFGMVAGETICDAIQKGDASTKSLAPYEEAWRVAEERNFRIALAIQRRISKYTDEHWDKNIRYLRNIEMKDPELLVQLFKANFSYRNIWRVFKQSPMKAIKTVLRSI